MTRMIDEQERDEALRQLDDVGYCVVPDVLDADEVAAARGALDRAAEEDIAAGRAAIYGPDGANQRVWALLNRGEEFVHMALAPVALGFVRATLGDDFILSNLCSNTTGPGGDREIGRLHTDQGFLPEPSAQLLVLNVAWFLDDFTEENGATVVVPGSHRLVEYPPHDLEPTASAQLIGRAGSLALIDGRLHHATGLNHTRDQKRRAVLAAYYLPYLRGQENWTQSLDADVLRAHPELAAVCGFEEWATLGGVHGPRTSSLNF
jgi:ectoine hydroxylase-related dioxygenase (phytanoyl-CoA dioxygenase family)